MRYMQNTSSTISEAAMMNMMQRNMESPDQKWKGLKKAWLGYTIAKNKAEDDKLVYYRISDSEITKGIRITTGEFFASGY